MKVSIQKLDPARSVDVASVARMHCQLIPDGIARLGELFLRRVVYGALNRDGLVRSWLCRVDGAAAGFVTITGNASGFTAEACRRHPVLIAASLAASVIRSPATVRHLAGMVRLRDHGEPAPGQPDAELMAFGVLPEFRSTLFIRRTKTRLSRMLFEHAAVELLRMGHHLVQANVLRENAAVLNFYRMMPGAHLCHVSEEFPLQPVRVDLDRFLREGREQCEAPLPLAK